LSWAMLDQWCCSVRSCWAKRRARSARSVRSRTWAAVVTTPFVDGILDAGDVVHSLSDPVGALADLFCQCPAEKAQSGRTDEQFVTHLPTFLRIHLRPSPGMTGLRTTWCVGHCTEDAGFTVRRRRPPETRDPSWCSSAGRSSVRSRTAPGSRPDRRRSSAPRTGRMGLSIPHLIAVRGRLPRRDPDRSRRGGRASLRRSVSPPADGPLCPLTQEGDAMPLPAGGPWPSEAPSRCWTIAARSCEVVSSMLVVRVVGVDHRPTVVVGQTRLSVRERVMCRFPT
jgi:hypothetical protein